ncbi:MAG: S-layer homology domain-containing protein, partial [Oscillospiraceae bacterium]|nr:S-layer homology domain-containing protein [Oscillospiraceae bacterium]
MIRTMETRKSTRLISMIMAFVLILTSIPNFGILVADAAAADNTISLVFQGMDKTIAEELINTSDAIEITLGASPGEAAAKGVNFDWNVKQQGDVMVTSNTLSDGSYYSFDLIIRSKESDTTPPPEGPRPTSAPSRQSSVTAEYPIATSSAPPDENTPESEETIQEEEIPLAGFNPNHIRYIFGYPDGTVRPDNPLTRAEMCAFLFRLLIDEHKNDALDAPFPDVEPDSWYYQAVTWLAETGIVTGYPNGSFAPDAPITRAEFVTMAARFDDLEPDYSVSFPDIADHWAKDYIISVAGKGWIIGDDSGAFRPDQNLTRAEATTVVNRMLNRRVDKDGLPEWIPIYPDLLSTHWAYAEVIEASTGHEYERAEDDSEIWTEQISDSDPLIRSVKNYYAHRYSGGGLLNMFLTAPSFSATALGLPNLSIAALSSSGYVVAALGSSGFGVEALSSPSLSVTAPGTPGFGATTSGSSGYDDAVFGTSGFDATTFGSPSLGTTVAGSPRFGATAQVVGADDGHDGVVDSGAGYDGVVSTGVENGVIVHSGAGYSGIADTGVENGVVVGADDGYDGVVSTGAGYDGIVSTGVENGVIVGADDGYDGVVSTGAGYDGVVSTGAGDNGDVNSGVIYNDDVATDVEYDGVA